MKKAEMHVHVSPVSYCAREDAEYTAERYYKCGFKAIHLTNHINLAYMDVYGVSYDEWLEIYINGYHEMVKACQKYGIEVFLGAEVTVFAPGYEIMQRLHTKEELEKNYADYLLIGVTEEFLRNNPRLCFKDQRELFEICERNNVLMLQAHPFRVEQHHSLKDLNYLHGLEINGNLEFASGSESEDRILQLAREHDLIVVCGGDVHSPWNSLNSCTFIPDDIHDSVALAKWLRRVKIPQYSLIEVDEFVASKP